MRNWGIVVDGLLYRSGKYSARELRETVGRYGIRRVIDLRNQNPLLAASTYKRMDVEFETIQLSEQEPLPAGILDVFDGQAPTLIHCWKGAHRTGAWVAALRRRQGWGRVEIDAELQRYGFGAAERHRELYESIWTYEI